MSKTGKQIAISEAVAVNKSLSDSMFSDDEVSLIVRLAWTARRSNTTYKGVVYQKIARLIDDVSRRHISDEAGSVEG
jgi:hypothetical protein